MIGANQQRIGRCSICGGDVVLPIVWMAIVPPHASCSRCGAVESASGPVVPMQPRESKSLRERVLT